MLSTDRITSTDIQRRHPTSDEYVLELKHDKLGGIVEQIKESRWSEFGRFQLKPDFRRWLIDHREFLIRTHSDGWTMQIIFPSVAAAMAFKMRWV
jgi:hypothetical protein